MEAMYLSELVYAVQGDAINCINDVFIEGISTDSRKVKPGELFIPIIGENFDGHSFINNAIAAGAVAVLSDRYLDNKAIPYVKVSNTEEAFINIAKHYRSKFNIPAIGITGSSGKTTTKEMVAAVLSQSFNVLKNKGNFNNTIGLPHTIMELDKNHEICVMEMGMNSFGEISKLTSIVKPDTAVITNIGTAHIEYLGNRKNILKAKLEIIENFTAQNTLIINGDDEMLKTINSKDFAVMSFGLNKNNDIFAFDCVQINNEGTKFYVNIEDKSQLFYIPLIGSHNIYNSLCAIAIGIQMGIKIEKIKLGLSNFKPPEMRMESFTSKDGTIIINDAYNANPESMKAAIETLSSVRSKSRKILVLGDMLELGDYADNEHYKVGSYAALNDMDILVTIGKKSKLIQKGALDNGIKKAFHFDNNQSALGYLNEEVRPFDTILIKGSRAGKMEEIAYFLRERR